MHEPTTTPSPAPAPPSASIGAAGTHQPPRVPPGARVPRPRDAGMATAEYAIATLAACGFAGLLVTILTSGEVRGMLMGIVQRALSVG